MKVCCWGRREGHSIAGYLVVVSTKPKKPQKKTNKKTPGTIGNRCKFTSPNFSSDAHALHF